jgi:hypothetical protein
MRLLLLPLFLVFSCVTSKAVVGPEAVDYFIDNAGRKYYLLADDRFITDNQLGQNQFSYYDSSLGAPTSIDVSDPFALLLFYAEYGTVVVLDRTLSEVSRIDLFSLENIRQPEALARASNRGIWVFDSWDYRLKLLGPQGKPSQTSNDLRLELKTSALPTAILVDRNMVLLHYVEEQKVAIFTNYGRFKRWVSLPPAAHISWRTPYLTGNSYPDHWTYRVGDLEARTQVQSELKGKIYATPAGVYHLDESGFIRIKQK